MRQQRGNMGARRVEECGGGGGERIRRGGEVKGGVYLFVVRGIVSRPTRSIWDGGSKACHVVQTMRGSGKSWVQPQ